MIIQNNTSVKQETRNGAISSTSNHMMNPLNKLAQYLGLSSFTPKFLKRLEKDTLEITNNVKSVNIPDYERLLSSIDLQPSTPVTKLNVENIESSALVMVHKTQYEPKNGIILSTGDAIAENGVKGSRNTVHFALNHSVQSNNGGNWNNCSYAIITPFDAEAKENPDLSFEGMPNDFYSKGSVKIPEGSVIIKYNPDVPQNEIKYTDYSEKKGIKVIETSDNVNNLIKPVIEKMGYSYAETSPDIGIGVFKETLIAPDDTNLNDYTKSALDAYKNWSDFCKNNNIQPMKHGCSPYGQVEKIIEALDMLATRNNYSIKNFSNEYDYKTAILYSLQNLKSLRDSGYKFDIDLDKLEEIIVNSTKPEEALSQIRDKLKIKPCITRKRNYDSKDFIFGYNSYFSTYFSPDSKKITEFFLTDTPSIVTLENIVKYDREHTNLN